MIADKQHIVVPKETRISAAYRREEQPISPEEKLYYEDCKQYYYITERPLISISEEILTDDVELVSPLLKFGIDEDHSQFNLEEFLNKVCGILNITRDEIIVRGIQNGSVIIETELSDKFESKEKKLKIQVMYHTLTDKIRQQLAKLKVFFMYMGAVKPLAQMQKLREKILLYPKFNRVYCIGQIYWTGVLHDGKDRGNQPYYCPVGWKRYTFFVTDDFDGRFKGWCICYHGTKFNYGLSILLSGLKPAERNEHGSGIYATPSINYACHPRYSEVKLIESSHQKKFFKNGKYVQFALECRVHPKNIKKIAKETLGGSTTTIDENITNDKIEWLIDAKNKAMVDFNDPDSSIVCTGLMVRVTDNHPGLLPKSQWWHEAHLCNNLNCCCLGIKLDELKQQKYAGMNCNIIYE